MTVLKCDICGRKVCLGNCTNYGKLKAVAEKVPEPKVEEPKKEKKAKKAAKKTKK
tara:strand:- start:1364 stop:1528 length:165 start_codon:yes stop_codon:yes gene_type:complete